MTLDLMPVASIVGTAQLEKDRAARQSRIRQEEIERGQYIEGGLLTWYASLHYSNAVWDVLKDREWRLKQARR